MRRRRSSWNRTKLRAVKLLALDVDGVLTDGKVTYGRDGEELKTFSFQDIMGLSLARKRGLRIALVSGEKSRALERLAAKLHIEEVCQSCKDKLSAVEAIRRKRAISLQETCYIGDDVNDLSVLRKVGVAVVPPNAVSQLLAEMVHVTQASGGNGAVREVVDLILEAHEVRLR